MASPSLAPTYQIHINGLRAVAISGVLLYHLRADYCPAGYFGVDLFLVISGYLLFRSLLHPDKVGQFRYGSFLLRKAWRIIPLWFIVTVVACSVALYLLPMHRLEDIIKTARYSALFRADNFIDKSGDYFNTYSQQNPMLHFWYLSITQQLYLIAPLLVIPLARWVSRKAAVILLAVLALLSLAYYVLTTSQGLVPPALSEKLLGSAGFSTAYYHLLPRFWEVTAGIGLVLLPEWKGRPALRALLGLAGLVAILASFWLYGTGSAAIYLTIAGSILALRYADVGPAGRLLSLRPVQAIGTISFSLYLWHWPVMVFWKYCRLDAPGPWDEAGMVLLSLLLGACSWACIERLRMPSTAGIKRLVSFCALILGMILSVVGVGLVFKHIQRQNPSQDMLINLEEPAPEATAVSGKLLRGLEALPEYGMGSAPLRIGAAEAPASFLFMGDSHAWHLHHALHEALIPEGIAGVYLNNSTMPYWYRDYPKQFNDACVWNEAIADCLISYLKEQDSIGYVIIAQSWMQRMSEGFSSDWRSGKAIEAGEESRAASAEGLRELCRRVNEVGKKVILLCDTPHFESPAPFDTWQRSQRHTGIEYRERYVTQAEHEEKQRIPRDLLAGLEAEGLAICLDPAPALMVDGRYPARVGSSFLYFDRDHLSLTGARRVIQGLLPTLRGLLRPEGNENGAAR